MALVHHDAYSDFSAALPVWRFLIGVVLFAAFLKLILPRPYRKDPDA